MQIRLHESATRSLEWFMQTQVKAAKVEEERMPSENRNSTETAPDFSLQDMNGATVQIE